MDDGTVGKYGAEVRLRRELEKTVNQQEFMLVRAFINLLLKLFWAVLIASQNAR